MTDFATLSFEECNEAITKVLGLPEISSELEDAIYNDPLATALYISMGNKPLVPRAENRILTNVSATYVYLVSTSNRWLTLEEKLLNEWKGKVALINFYRAHIFDIRLLEGSNTELVRKIDVIE